MTLQQAMYKLQYDHDDIYYSASDFYIIRPGIIDIANEVGRFWILYPKDADWKGGFIWFGLSVNQTIFQDYIERYAGYDYCWFTNKLVWEHAEDHDDWQVLSIAGCITYMKAKIKEALNNET